MEQRERNPNDNTALAGVGAIIAAACIALGGLAMWFTSLSAH